MPRGGYRPGAGPKRGKKQGPRSVTRQLADRVKAELATVPGRDLEAALAAVALTNAAPVEVRLVALRRLHAFTLAQLYAQFEAEGVSLPRSRPRPIVEAEPSVGAAE